MSPIHHKCNNNCRQWPTTDKHKLPRRSRFNVVQDLSRYDHAYDSVLMRLHNWMVDDHVLHTVPSAQWSISRSPIVTYCFNPATTDATRAPQGPLHSPSPTATAADDRLLSRHTVIIACEWQQSSCRR